MGLVEVAEELDPTQWDRHDPGEAFPALAGRLLSRYPEVMSSRDQDLLFGVAALQSGRLDEKQLLDLARRLLASPGLGAAEAARQDGLLSKPAIAATESLVESLLELHGGDAQRSLMAAGAANPPVLRSIGQLARELAPVGPEGAAHPLLEQCRRTLLASRELERLFEDAAKLLDEADVLVGGGPAPDGVGRYQLRDELGRGGLGRVVLAVDPELNREIAVKLLLAPSRPPTADADHGSAAVFERFVEEAQITGQLEHPNIVPVYELGRAADGTRYYTMRLLRGRSLRKELNHAWTTWPRLDAIEQSRIRIRLLQTFLDVCNAVAYAHTRGVVHRDLKPENVMVGDFGETLVIDWGLAKVIPDAPHPITVSSRVDPERTGAPDERAGQWRDRQMLDRIRTVRERADFATHEGVVLGTPVYAPPEQVEGRVREVDARSDVYSLGAMLYEILTLQMPFEVGPLDQVVRQVLSGDVPTPRQRAPEMDIPAELEAVVLKAMARDKAARYRSADQLRAAVEDYLEGTKRREEALRQARRLVEEAARHVDRHRSLQAELSTLEDAVRRLHRAVKPWQPADEKRDLWELEDRIRDDRGESTRAFTAATNALMNALHHAPDLDQARNGLCELYWGELVAAETRDDHVAIAHYRSMVEQHDPGGYAERLKGDGALEIQSDPAGAEVYLFRFLEKERRLLPVPVLTRPEDPARPTPLGARLGALDPNRPPESCCSPDNLLGVTPTPTAAIEMGSYLCMVRAPGRRDTRYPVLIERAAQHQGKIRLFSAAEVGDGLVHVPGGAFLYGGDPDAVACGRRQVVELEDFFVATHPVTCHEYLEFLDHLAESDPVEARRRCPRSAPDGGQYWFQDAAGAHHIPTAAWDAAGPADRGGRKLQSSPLWWQEDWPVVGVSWEDAVAYCRWLSGQRGRSFTLLDERQWEKAARGVDGRLYPWGNRFDATFCNCSTSHREGMRPLPVTESPADESPYGVRGLGGNAADWCLNPPQRSDAEALSQHPDWRLLRGGGWGSMEPYHRAASRGGYVRSFVLDHLGFRVCSNQPAGEERVPQRPDETAK